MKRAEERARGGQLVRKGAMPVVDQDVVAPDVKPGVVPKLSSMLLPLLTLVIAVPIGIVITGYPSLRDSGGSLLSVEGMTTLLRGASGETAVFWGVSIAVALSVIWLKIRRIFSFEESVQLALKGASGMVTLATIMTLAFAIGMTCKTLATGPYVAEVTSSWLTPLWIAPVLFIVSGFMAFSTGTSWGTFAIMIPLAIPLVAAYQNQGQDVSTPMIVSAVLGGGVFGDHCSPISDTTVVSSMAACSDHMDHVRTQLPYALTSATLAFGAYFIAGWAGLSG